MVLVVYFLPEGIVPAVRSWWRGRKDTGDAPQAKAEPVA